MPKYVPRDQLPDLTEAEYALIRRLISRELNVRRCDANSEDNTLSNYSAIVLPSRENLIAKFPIRPAMLPTHPRHFPPEEF